jgi:hypothetical protein
LPPLVHVSERAGAGSARIAAGSAGPTGSGRASRAFRRYGENTQLGGELPALTLRTLRFVAAKYQSLKLVLTLLADIFKNRHVDHSRAANFSY